MAQKEIIKTKQEIAYLEDLLVQIEHARDEDLEDIRTELQDEGYIKKQKKKKKKTTKPMPEKFTAHDGTPIRSEERRVGRECRKGRTGNQYKKEGRALARERS